MIADLIAGRAPGIDPTPFAPRRAKADAHKDAPDRPQPRERRVERDRPGSSW
jgi:hypothetical protein